MLIPSIDLQGGRIVQLVQGETLAVEATDPEPWITKFSRFPRVQLIDLDAAKGQGDNRPMVTSICARLPCRVGGGIRSIERAEAMLAAGARGDRQLRSFPPRRRRHRFRAGARRSGRARARHRCGRQPRWSRRHTWLANTVAFDGGRRRPDAESVLRRVPLHPCRHGRTHARHQHGRDPCGSPRHGSPRHGRRRHRRKKKSSASMPNVSTPWLGWPSTPASCRSMIWKGNRTWPDFWRDTTGRRRLMPSRGRGRCGRESPPQLVR